LNGGNAYALTVKLVQEAKLLAKGQRSDAVRSLRDDFIGQANGHKAAGELSATPATSLLTSGQGLIRYINMTT